MKKYLQYFLLLLFLSPTYSFATPKGDLENIINILKSEYTFGGNKSEILEFSNSRWKYYYQIFDNYAIFKILDIYDGDEVDLGTVIIKEGFTFLIDISTRKIVYQVQASNMGGGSIGRIDESGSDMQTSKKIDFDKNINAYFNSKNIGNSIYDYDSYVFSLKESGKVTIDFSNSTSSSYIYLKEFSRKKILEKHYMDGDKITLDLSAGYYHLLLRSQGKIGGSGKDHAYNLNLSCINSYNGKCKTLSDDFPNSFSSAVPINIDNILTGNIDYKNDLDFFKFSIPKDELYDFSIKGTGIILSLYNSETHSINAGCRKNSLGLSCRNYLRKGTYFMVLQSDKTSYYLPDYKFALSCPYCTNGTVSINERMRFPVDGDDWIVTLGSSEHRDFGNKNDTFALDLGLSGNADSGKSVYPVVSGTVHAYSDTYGALVIKHDAGGDYAYSLYMHMNNIPESLKTVGVSVNQQRKLGEISNTGTNGGADHLHFAIYKEDNRRGIDIGNTFPIGFLDNITTWYNSCSNPTPSSNGSYDSPWWSLGEKPCNNIGSVDYTE